MYKIAVAGLGYVGLANAILLAQNHEVRAYDVVTEKVEQLRKGKTKISDTEIQEYLNRGTLNLIPESDPEKAYRDVDFVIAAVPTDYDPEQNYFDTSRVEAVIEQAVKYAPDATIIIKSTVPSGYTKKVCKKYGIRNIAFSPEFLREGRALYDNLYPSRIVVGMDEKDEEAVKKAHIFAKLLLEGARKKDVPVFFMGSTEAETVKLFANTFLAMRVAFFNEMDTYAETKNLDIRQMIQGVCADPRIGDYYNNPSFGYGGYCLPKDTKQLLANYQDIPEKLIRAVVESNEIRKRHITGMIVGKKPQTVGIYRLIMKSESDNFRHSSIVDILEYILDQGIRVLIYEPVICTNVYHGASVIDDLERFKKVCDVILTNRYSSDLDEVADKVYTRDVFGRD